MLRNTLIAAVALLAAGTAGLITAEAQPGKKATAVKMSEVKKVEAVQKEFNQVVNALVALVKAMPGKRSESEAVETKVQKNAAEKRAWKTTNDKSKDFMTLSALEKLQKDVNARFDAAKKSGKLTAMDRNLLKQTTLAGMKQVLAAR